MIRSGFQMQTVKKASLNKPEYQEAARDIARKSIVLLKNTDNLLPLIRQSEIHRPDRTACKSGKRFERILVN